MRRRLLVGVLLTLLLGDLVFAFYQYGLFPLDGDMAAIILPGDWYRQVLSDPFGWQVLWEGKTYAATNRFFCHFSMSQYFKVVPGFLQYFFTPLASVYIACALFKLFVHLGLLIVLTRWSTVGTRWHWPSFFIIMVLLSPFFQASGYHRQMGLIDPSITYTFFYAFPLLLLLLFLLPLFRLSLDKKLSLTPWQHLYLVALLFVVPFSGPLIPAIGLLVGPVALGYTLWRYLRSVQLLYHWRPKPFPWISIYLFGLFAWSGFSFYIGQFNFENQTDYLPLWDRYQRLCIGTWKLFSVKLGLPLLLASLLIGNRLRRKMHGLTQSDTKENLTSIILLFSLLYLLLLPLGGYRSYRPWIIRYDTLMPITLGLIIIYGRLINHFLSKIPALSARYFLTLTLGLLVAFTLADGFPDETNACEKKALKQLAQSRAVVQQLSAKCTIMHWKPVSKAEETILNATLLHYWGVLPRPIRYEQKERLPSQE